MKVLAAVLMAAPATIRPLAAQSVAERVAADVRYLADDRREGRGVGSAGLDSAAQYIAAAFAALRLRPGGGGDYFQRFTIDPTAPAAAHAGVGGVAAKNVVAILPGTGDLARQAVVIGAHYDHLGRGGFGSMDPDSTGVIHNGADDNASGTAGLLEIARLLVGRRAGAARTVVFVAFAAEELGVIGSAHYVRHAPHPIDSTYAMINLDMVGRLREGNLTAFGAASAREFPALLDSLAAAHRLTVKGSGDGYGPSDQSSFFGADIPVLHFFTGLHEDYHRTTDDADKINAQGIAQVAELAAGLAWTLATRRAPLTFVDAQPPPPVVGGGSRPYLGTVPDMTESPGGVRLTGVRAGSPAEAAGVRAGDVLVQLGEHQIKNLYDMENALRAYQPGDSIVVGVLRDGRRLDLRAALGRRGG